MNQRGRPPRATNRPGKRVTGRGADAAQRSPRPLRKPTASSRPKKLRPAAAPPIAPADASAPQRLQKLLAECGVGSRRRCEEYIVLGRVCVDGKVVTELGTTVDPIKQTVQVDGETVRRAASVYWWLNKPRGVLCTSMDDHGRPTVLDFVPRISQRVYSVGRLDEDSTGLVLLTNDGALAQRLTHPRYGVSKTYDVLVAGYVGPAIIATLKAGVRLSDGKVRPSAIRRLGGKGHATRLQIVLREGRNREIRRMFAQLGHKVMRLERTALGPVKVRKLKPGQSRPATADEVHMLKEAAGRREAHQSTPSEPASPPAARRNPPRKHFRKDAARTK